MVRGATSNMALQNWTFEALMVHFVQVLTSQSLPIDNEMSRMIHKYSSHIILPPSSPVIAIEVWWSFN